MKKNLSSTEIGEIFRKYTIRMFPANSMTTNELVAIHYDVSRPLISQICSGKRSPTLLMLKDLGYEKNKTFTFRRLEK